MKTSTRKRAIFELAAVALAITAIAAYAQFSQPQSISYKVSPTITMTLQPVSLGTLTGGATAASQTFTNVLSFTLSQSGIYTISATLTVNDTVFAELEIYVQNSSGQVCQLQGGSSISTISTCSWTITGNSVYSETILAGANDGISVASGLVQPRFTAS